MSKRRAEGKLCDCVERCGGGAFLDIAEWITHAPYRELSTKRPRLQSSHDQPSEHTQTEPADYAAPVIVVDRVSSMHEDHNPLPSEASVPASAELSGGPGLAFASSSSYRVPSMLSSSLGEAITGSSRLSPLATSSASSAPGLPAVVPSPFASLRPVSPLDKLGDRNTRDKKVQRQRTFLEDLTDQAQDLLRVLEADAELSAVQLLGFHGRFNRLVEQTNHVKSGQLSEARQGLFDILSKAQDRLGPSPPTEVFDSCEYLTLYFTTASTYASLPAAHFDLKIDHLNPAAQLYTVGAAFQNLVANVGEKRTNLHLGAFREGLREYHGMMGLGGTSLEPWRTMPEDMKTALSHLNLESPVWTTYQFCQQCKARYPILTWPGSGKAVYRARCSGRFAFPPDGKWVGPVRDCTADLLDSKGKPLHVIMYQDPRDFVAAHLAVPEWEDMLDDMPTRVLEANRSSQKSSVMCDIVDAAYVANLRDQDGITHFLERSGSDGRLLWELFYDDYNPEGLRLRGRVTSVGVVMAALYGLPANIRYRREHVFIACIIPDYEHKGTTQSKSLHNIRKRQPTNHNHSYVGPFLEPIVEHFVRGYHPGWQISRTARYPTGRNIRSMIAVNVADLVAMRHSLCHRNSLHKVFCTYCTAWEQRGSAGPLHKLFGTIMPEGGWTLRSPDHWRNVAKRFAESNDYPTRFGLWEKEGHGDSPLLALPYFDPVRQAAAEAAHAVIEGGVNQHLRKALRISLSEAADRKKKKKLHEVEPAFDDSLPSAPADWSKEQKEELDKLHLVLRLPMHDEDGDDDGDEDIELDDPDLITEAELRSKLKRFNKPFLDIVHSGVANPGTARGRLTKNDLIDGLIEWVSLIIPLLETHTTF
jgi:hypothetical protein